MTPFSANQGQLVHSQFVGGQFVAVSCRGLILCIRDEPNFKCEVELGMRCIHSIFCVITS